MTPLQKAIAKKLKDRKKLHIHYHDTGQWFSTTKYEWEKYLKANDGYDFEKHFASGYDGDSQGYLPELVEALAGLLGITSDSI